MFWIDLFASLVVAFLFTLLFAVGLSRRGPWSSFLTYFTILFLAVWAGGLWLAPFGPTLFGVYWLPFFVIGLVVALLLGSAGPRTPEKKRLQIVRRRKQEEEARRDFDVFFLATVVVLFAAIVLGYLVA